MPFDKEKNLNLQFFAKQIKGGEMSNYATELATYARSIRDLDHRQAMIDLSVKCVDNLETRKAGLERLVTLNLPRYRKMLISLREFLANPEEMIKRLNNRGVKFYPKIVKESGERVYVLDVLQRELLEFIESQMKGSFQAKGEDTFFLSEYFQNIYSGTLKIKDGSIFIECWQGKHEHIAHGHGRSILLADNDPILGNMRFQQLPYKPVPEFEKSEEFRLLPPWTDEEFEKLKLALVKTLSDFPRLKSEERENLSRFRPFSGSEKTVADDSFTDVLPEGEFDFTFTKFREEDEDYFPVFIDSRKAKIT